MATSAERAVAPDPKMVPVSAAINPCSLNASTMPATSVLKPAIPVEKIKVLIEPV